MLPASPVMTHKIFFKDGRDQGHVTLKFLGIKGK